MGSPWHPLAVPRVHGNAPGGVPGEIRFGGRVVGPAALARIRQFLRANPSLPQIEIARRLCEMFEFRRPNGRPAIQGCIRFLWRLARRGRVRLPPSWKHHRARTRRVRSAVEIDAETAFQADRCVRLAEGAGLRLRLLQSTERAAFLGLMRLHHYLGDRLPSGETVRQIAFWSGTPIALIEWSSASLYNGPRDRWIDWDQDRKARRLHLVANNSRFLMLPTTEMVRVPNLASRVLSASLRRLSRDFLSVYGHPIFLAETFVDAARFRGTCYRASNWFNVGETKGWSKRGDDYHFHGRKKLVFLFPVDRRARTWLGGHNCPKELVTRMASTLPIDFTKLNIEGSGGLIEVFRSMTDPRMPRGVRHPIAGLLSLAATAVMAGYRSFQAFGEWAENLPKEIRARLGSTWPKPPTEATFRRVFAKINVEEFETRTAAWIAAHQALKGRAIAIDGKTLRGSGDGDRKATHLVSAVTHEDGVVIAQVRVPEKTNEITSVEPLLSEVDVRGVTVTGDAMFAQTKIANHLVEEKGADYIFTVKDNQPGLRAAIENMGLESFSPSASNDQHRPWTT
jgi:Domain of unknown function (DUF4338)/DDE_Tnp_1-associated/Transposase DDE domain